MPQLEKAVKLMDTPEKREAFEKLFIDYFPDIGNKDFPKDKTGGDIDQDTKTEFDLGWHMTLNESGCPILISHNATAFKLTLKGEDGWRNLEEMLQDYCKCCYSSKILEAEGRCLTPEDFKKLSSFLKETEKEAFYVLAKQFKSRSRLYTSCVCHTKEGFRILQYIKMKENFELTCSVRPTVLLPENVQLLLGDQYYDGSTKERGLRIGDEDIIICVDKERRIAYLKQKIKSTEEYLRELQRELGELENQ